MTRRDRPQEPRVRVLLWYRPDADRRRPTQVAGALYIEDEKVTEVTWEPGPFDDLGDLVQELLDSVAPQQLHLF